MRFLGTGPASIAAVITKSGSYTLSVFDSSTVLRLDTTANASVTLPANLPVGFQVAVEQANTGQVTFTPSTGATLVSRLNFTKTAGHYATVTLLVVANADNASAQYLLMGDAA